MPTTIRDAASVSFSIAPRAVSSDLFNYFLILDETTSQKARVGTYSSISAMADAGFSTSESAYVAASNVFAQTSKDGRKLPAVKVGRKYVDANSKVTITFDQDATAGTFTIDVSKADGAAVTSGTIAWDETVAATIETTIEAMSNVSSITVTINGTNAGDAEGITIEWDGADANILFEVTDVDVSSLTTVTTATVTQDVYGSATETYTAAFNAIVAADSSFWGFAPTSVTEADIDLLAASAETANSKMLWGLTRDSDVKDAVSNDVASELKALGYKKTLLVYNEDTDSYATCAWAGATLPDFLGAVNPCYYPMTGVTADTLTDTEITNMIGKFVNRVETIGGSVVVPGVAPGATDGAQGGYNVSGQFIDQIFAKDYLEVKVSEAIYTALIAEKRITSLTQIDTIIRETLEVEGVARGIIEAGSIDTGIDTATLTASTRTANFDNGTADLEDAVSRITVTFKLTA